MSSLRRLDELRVDAQYHRQRLDLYRAKVYGPRPTSPSRLKELERASVLSASLLRRAEQELEAKTAAHPAERRAVPASREKPNA